MLYKYQLPDLYWTPCGEIEGPDALTIANHPYARMEGATQSAPQCSQRTLFGQTIYRWTTFVTCDGYDFLFVFYEESHYPETYQIKDGTLLVCDLRL